MREFALDDVILLDFKISFLGCRDSSAEHVFFYFDVFQFEGLLRGGISIEESAE